jgi:hypothetical protein
VVVQFAREDQPFIEPGMMFFQVCFAHPAVVAIDTDVA